MVFVIRGPGKDVVVDDQDQQLLSELPRAYCLRTPVCDGLWERFYSDPQLPSPQQVAQLKSEIQAVRAAHQRLRREEVARERKVRAQDPAVATRIVDQLLAADPVLAKCDQIIEVCDAALDSNEGLICSSD